MAETVIHIENIDADSVSLKLSNFVDVAKMTLVNEMRSLLLNMQLRKLRMRAVSTSLSTALRIRIVAAVAISAALVCFTQQLRVAGCLLLLGIWDNRVGIPTALMTVCVGGGAYDPPENSKHHMTALEPARLATFFRRTQLRDTLQLIVVTALSALACAADTGGWWGATNAASDAASVTADIATKAVMAHTLFSVLWDAYVLALHWFFATEAAAVHSGCLRSRLLMHMCVWERQVDGDDGAFVEHLAGRTAGFEWRMIWLAANLNQSAFRMYLCGRVSELLKSVRTVVLVQLMQTNLLMRRMEMHQHGPPPLPAETPEARERRCMEWLRERGARIEDAWWGAADEMCTVCLCQLSDPALTAAAAPAPAAAASSASSSADASSAGTTGTAPSSASSAASAESSRVVASFPCCANHAHVFHAKCLCRWLARHNDMDAMTCPLCRSTGMAPVAAASVAAATEERVSE